MTFVNLNLKTHYDTSNDDFINDFFQPLLQESIQYDRGVGYFSSSWLTINSKGMTKFAENGGYARWITSPVLSKADWDHLWLGDKARHDEFLHQLLLKSVKNLLESLEKNTLDALSWLISDKILDFKLAVPRNQLSGEFHDKFGIFTDNDGNKISFSGSYNDSLQGIRNYESITVFKSWDPNYQEVVFSEQKRFGHLWENEDPNIRVFSLPESVKYEIIKFRPISRPYKNTQPAIFDVSPLSILELNPSLPNDINIRTYQSEAFNSWKDNGYCGFFEMATGTGKTITSLFSALQVFNDEGRLALVISVPYIHLVDQWSEIARKFNFTPILAYKSSELWKNELGNKIIAFNKNYINNLCVITTHSTFATEIFHSLITKILDHNMLIIDEAHHFGTANSVRFFPQNFEKKLALSATPTRWFDDEGTINLQKFLGHVVYRFPLDRAIKEGFLTKYFYYPIIVSLNDEEILHYREISKKIAPLFFKKDKSKREHEQLTALLIKRSNILKNAQSKFSAFRELISNLNNIHHCICYCSPEQKDSILSILGIENNISTHQFTYRENNVLRQDILDQCNEGILQVIVAIKCLDEGVDVPSSKLAFFLANSTNPREFIQRRGRVLRNYKNKDFAYLYDFLTVPPVNEDYSIQELNRSILRKELNRFSLFANSSENKHAAYEVIWKIAKTFGVLDFSED